MSSSVDVSARFIVNDTYRSELCLLYPPHLIAIAAIYLTLILHVPTRTIVLNHMQSQSQPHSQSPPKVEQTTPTPQPRRSSRQALHASSSSEHLKKPAASQDPITFLAELNVSLPLIATIAQEIISLYTLWDRYKEDASSDSARASFAVGQGQSPFPAGGGGSGAASKRSASGSGPSRSGSLNSHSNSATPAETREDAEGWNVFGGGGTGSGSGSCVTPMFLTALLIRMREGRLADMAHPASGRPVAVNKMLERTQAAG